MTNVHRLTTRCRVLGACLAALLLAACSSKGDIDIGGGQGGGQNGADPGTVDFPIAYVKRTIPEDPDDLARQRVTAPDADLYLRDRASPAAAEHNITERLRTATATRFDIKDVNASYDGRKLVFALRGPLPEDPDDREEPLWAIWEYDIGNDDLHRVIASDIVAAGGNDIAPAYLADGRIVFSSTRQSGAKAILRDEGKPGFEAQTETFSESAFSLHVMNADGSDIHQITYNQSHDLWPTLRADGKIIFTRWDAVAGRGMHLYTVNPDGSDLQLLYGARSHETGPFNDQDQNETIQFVRPLEMQDGGILTLTRPFTGSEFGADLTIINTEMFVENEQPLVAFAGTSGPAQSRATPNEVWTGEGPSDGGRFRSGWPLWDGTDRILVSWSLCRALDETVTPARVIPCTDEVFDDPDPVSAPPLYSAFMFNPADNTFKPLFQPQEGVMVTDVVALQPRTPPALRLDHTVADEDFDPALVAEGVGVLEIRSVYDFEGTLRNVGAATSLAQLADPRQTTVATQRPARFLRLVKAVSIGDNDLNPDFPDLDGAAFGASPFMREILGYVPIEPDGSVSVRVPANTAFQIAVLDSNGRRFFPAHSNWLQLRPGEVRRCQGCHQGTAQRDLSHGRDGTTTPVPWAGAAGASPAFPNTLAATAANALPGDTMAQARARTSCRAGSLCSQLPSVNILYDDVWTDPVAAGRAADASFARTYATADGFTTPPPVRTGCMSAWNSTCRIVINYLQHVHPLWSKERGANTCTNCHSTVNAAGVTRVPAGQLDLSDNDSDTQPLHKQAYEDLVVGDNQQVLVGGALQDVQNNGQPVGVPPSLVVEQARNSTRFFNRFAQNTGTIDHRNFLTQSELRLISEWVDIGGQYFNDPFADGVPVN